MTEGGKFVNVARRRRMPPGRLDAAEKKVLSAALNNHPNRGVIAGWGAFGGDLGPWLIACGCHEIEILF
jgi:hypothetical protein